MHFIWLVWILVASGPRAVALEPEVKYPNKSTLLSPITENSHVVSPIVCLFSTPIVGSQGAVSV